MPPKPSTAERLLAEFETKFKVERVHRIEEIYNSIADAIREHQALPSEIIYVLQMIQFEVLRKENTKILKSQEEAPAK